MRNRVDEEAPELSLTANDANQCGHGPRQSSEMKEPNEAMVSRWTRIIRSSWWDTAFVVACVIAVSLDPLFFYIPIIDRAKKCIGADTQLKVVTLIFRTITDFPFIVHIIYQIREAIVAADSDSISNEKSAVREDSNIFSFFESVGKAVDKLPRRSLITDIIAVLPIPQVLLVFVFFQMTGSGYLEHRKILNCFLLAQYVARIYRIYLSCKTLTKAHGIWIKGALNFFLYILASHVLGAFWYFFSIQRETSCWHRKCGDQCRNISFFCDKYTNTTDMTSIIALINESCPIQIDGPFDFGIFLESLRSNNTISTNFPQKLCYSFWWGLRNLSNFGTNLVTSNYVWENCFAIAISIIGLLLFLYLIGNVQTFIAMETENSEEMRRKIKSKVQDMTLWMDKNRLPQNLRKEIITNIREKLPKNGSLITEDKDADIENLFSILPWATKKSLKRFLCMSTLRKVPKLEAMDQRVLKMICDYLKPVVYPMHSYVAKMDDPVDRMVLVTEGTMWVYSPASAIRKCVQNGDVYGDEQLLDWATSKGTATPPFSKEYAKCDTKVKGFAITATELKVVASRCKMIWNYEDPSEKERVASSRIVSVYRDFRLNRNKPK